MAKLVFILQLNATSSNLSNYSLMRPNFLWILTREMCALCFCFILFCFVLFCFVLFYFILFYFILFYFILFYFILFYFILFYFILFYFIYSFLFYFILFYFILGGHSLRNNNPSFQFSGANPLHAACICASKPVVEYLIEKGSDPNSKTSVCFSSFLLFSFFCSLFFPERIHLQTNGKAKPQSWGQRILHVKT